MSANELHQELSELYRGLKSGKIKPAVACEMTNAAGKIIRLAELQVKFMGLNREVPKSSNRIEFLESTTV